MHQANYDLDAELGGYVPGLKDKCFFFGSFNPSWNQTATSCAIREPTGSNDPKKNTLSFSPGT